MSKYSKKSLAMGNRMVRAILATPMPLKARAGEIMDDLNANISRIADELEAATGWVDTDAIEAEVWAREVRAVEAIEALAA